MSQTLVSAIEIAEHLHRHPHALMRRVMVQQGRQKPRHVMLHRDRGGLYVRLDKRGQTKRYLAEFERAEVIAGDILIFVRW